MITADGLKMCGRCKKSKPTSEFYRCNSKIDGYNNTCKKCFETAFGPKKKRYRENWARRNPKHAWAHCVIKTHKGDGYVMHITTSELEKIAENVSNCPLCGCALDWTPLKGKKSPNSPSIDRINNGHMLSPENIMIICSKCNSTKLDRSFMEFYEYCKGCVVSMENIINKKEIDVEPDFITSLTKELRAFANERDWNQFRTHENLAKCISIESAELLELFQWGDSPRLDPAPEIADILIYLVQFADVMKIDLMKATWEKIKINAEKYPIEKAKGNCKKAEEL